MTSKIILWVYCLFLFAYLPVVQAQNIVLRGVVSDRQTGQPLEMANIILQEVSGDELEGTTTDGNGLYEFSGLQRGGYIFIVRYVGYRTYSDTLNLGQNE